MIVGSYAYSVRLSPWKYFLLQNKEINITFLCAGNIVLESQKGILVKIFPEKEQHRLYLQWFVPPSRDIYKYASCHYISHLLGDEGAGSVLALLKSLGYATSLAAGESGLSFKDRWVILHVHFSTPQLAFCI